MKTTITTLVVLICFLFVPKSLIAQYHGGIGDGSSQDHVTTAVCATPTQFYAYYGGAGDGSGMESLINITCGAPTQFYAYQGGIGGGSALETINAVTCGAPTQFYAYFGGNADGSSSDQIDAISCGNPNQFYAYFGGDGDGYGAGGTLSCPVDPPIANFTTDFTIVCKGNSVHFTDTSTNVPTVWEWTFEGGTPATSSLQNPEVLYNTPGTYDVTLNTVNQFGSNTKTMTDYITVNAIPTITSTTPAARCDAGIVTLGATASAGTLSWFEVATGGTALGTGASFNTPSISATTTFYVETENNDCTSTRVAVVATVNETPTITRTTPGERCGPGSVQLSAQASSGNIKWFAAPTGGVSLSNSGTFNTPSIATTTTYYVEVSENGCISPRTAVVATINSQPAITSTTDASRCGPGSVTLMAQSDFGTIKWYDAMTGGNLLTTGTSFTTPSLSVTKVYYVEAAQGSCSSSRVSVTAEINALPSITSVTPAARCGTGTLILAATTNAGTLRWFNVASGGTVLGTGTNFTTPSISATTSFYVESNNGGCISNRVEVIATVNSAPIVTNTTPGSRCGTGTVVLSATASSGTLSWFASSTGGSALGSGTSFTTPVIATTTTYYVQAQESGCTSTRTAVVATINTVPLITNTTPGSRCGAGTVTLMATTNSGTLNWFGTATGGTALATGTSFTTPSIANTTSFYVESSNALCTSGRTEVVATINALPTITSTTPSGRCGPGTVTLMAATDAGTLSWFNVASGGTALGTGSSFTTPSITTTTSYYVESNNGGCISNRVEVIATINDGPMITTTTPAERCGPGTVTLTATADYGTINWFANATGGTSLFTGANFTTPSLSVSTTYYVSTTSGSCTSDRVAVIATIKSTATIISTTPASRCGTGSVTLMAATNSGTLNWFNVPTGGTAIGSGTSFTTPSISTTTSFYVEANNGGCISNRVEVIATINATPTITNTTPASRCGTGSVTLTASASAGTLSWFNVEVGGTVLGTGTNFSTPVISSTTTFYVEATDNGCVSDRVAVVATVDISPAITATIPAERCGPGSVTLSATADYGTINWYANITGGASLFTGANFTTPNISITTPYYVSTTSTNCTSDRVPVTATVKSIPTITSTTPASRCDTGTLTLMASASAGSLKWFDVAVGGTPIGTGSSFTTPIISATTTFYVEANNNGCISERVAVLASINDGPIITSTTPGERCGVGSVTLSALADYGIINWYANATGGISIFTGTSFNTPNLSTTTTYYVSSSSGSCISPRVAVIATINPIPVITGTTPASRCGTGSVTLMATANAGTLNWFNVATGGTAIGSGTSFTTPSISTTTPYYVQSSNASCTSARTQVLATINALPIITSTTPAARCGSGTVTLMATASAGTLSWFDVATGGTVLGTGTSFTTPSISATTTFFVEANNNGCSSNRSAVIATVSDAPIIINTVPAERCGAGSVTLTATADYGTINWYASATGGTVLFTGANFATPNISVTTTYYVSAKSGNCTSDRIAVTATIKAVPTITSTTPASRCGSGTVTLMATANAGILSWFNAATGGTAVGTGTSFTTPSISTTTTFYVESSNGGCTSTRTAVIATVNQTPTITSTTPASRCNSGTVTLMATASIGTISWYANAAGGTAIGSGTSFTTPVITSTTTFYVQANNNGCLSNRVSVIATINEGPVITNTTPGERCGAGSVTLSATADSGTINWYANASGGTPLFTGGSFTTPNISTTTTYYVSTQLGDCTSDRVAVTATIKEIPAITSTTPASRCDSGTLTLMATSSSGTLKWYNVATGGTVLAMGSSFTTPVITATTTYYVEAENNGCISDREAVIATITGTPMIISTTPGERCGAGTVTLSASADSGTISWYANATGGTALFTGANFTTPVIPVTTTYYVSTKSGNCTSDRVAVIATIKTIPTITSTTPASRCDAGTVTLMATASTGILSWFDVATGGTALGTGTSFTTPSIPSTTSYYVESANGDCVSNRVEVIATVNVTPIITSTTPAERCGPGTLTLSATADAGSINWYASPTGGTSLLTGANFTTPFITETTTYYVSANTASCTSDRVPVTATININPTITSATSGERCGEGSVTLMATASGGTLSWFDVATGGSALGTGTTFITPSISETTTFYVESDNGGCISERIPVIATVNITVAPTGEANQTFCEGETVGMIVTDGTSVSWYDSAVSGNVLSDDTPIVSGTTYFASQTLEGCESTERLAVTMTTGICLGISNNQMWNVTVYPIPMDEVLHIQANDLVDTIEVYDLVGKLIFTRKTNSLRTTIDTSLLSSGPYLVFIRAGNRLKIHKVIKM